MTGCVAAATYGARSAGLRYRRRVHLVGHRTERVRVAVPVPTRVLFM